MGMLAFERLFGNPRCAKTISFVLLSFWFVRIDARLFMKLFGWNAIVGVWECVFRRFVFEHFEWNYFVGDVHLGSFGWNDSLDCLSFCEFGNRGMWLVRLEQARGR